MLFGLQKYPFLSKMHKPPGALKSVFPRIFVPTRPIFALGFRKIGRFLCSLYNSAGFEVENTGFVNCRFRFLRCGWGGLKSGLAGLVRRGFVLPRRPDFPCVSRDSHRMIMHALLHAILPAFMRCLCGLCNAFAVFMHVSRGLDGQLFGKLWFVE